MPHDELNQKNEANQNILAGLRAKPAADSKAEKLILVHRCNANSTDDRCQCNERITQSAANALLQSGEAEWLQTERGGKPYTRRDSIVIWSTAEALDQIAEKREADRKQRDRLKIIGTILKTFRNKLTKDEGGRWSDEEI